MRNVFYSKKHFDIAKGAEKPLEPQYYSVEEAMQKFGVTRDALYNQIKTNKIPKIKVGRYIKISKPELDNLYEEPIILLFYVIIKSNPPPQSDKRRQRVSISRLLSGSAKF